MSKRVRGVATVVLAMVLGAGASAPAEAAYPVIDIAAIRQLIAQVNYWKQQLSAMSNQLSELKQTHAALIGSRGMQSLLPQSAASRNYLPEQWSDLVAALDGQSRRYGELARTSLALESSRAVLDEAALARLGGPERASVLEARRQAAGQAAAARLAYAQASERFASLAELVSAIGRATDAKAIADLQGRIAAEQAMLENEQVKLTLMAEAGAADRALAAQQRRELAIAGHGVFADRLHPRP